MSKKEVKKTQVFEEDFELEQIPKTKRKTVIAIAFVLGGMALNSTEVVSGGVITIPLGLEMGILALAIGTFLDAALAFSLSFPAARYGVTFSLQTRYAFGTIGTKVPSFLMTVVLLGWLGSLIGLLANGIVDIFPGLNWYVVAIVGGLIMVVVSCIGVKGLQVFGYIAVPIVLITGVFGIYKVANSVPEFIEANPDASFMMGVSQAFAAAVTAGLVYTDVSRYGKTPFRGAVGAFIGAFCGLMFCRLVGSVTAAATGHSDYILSFTALGLGIPAFLFLVFNLTSSIDTQLYSVGLGFANVFNYSRVKLTIISGIIGIIITLSGMVNFWETWLNVLGIVIPPLGGIMLASYYVVCKVGYCALEDIKCKINWFAIIAWVVGIICSIVVDFCPALQGLIGSFIAYSIIMAILKHTNYDMWKYVTNHDEAVEYNERVKAEEREEKMV